MPGATSTVRIIIQIDNAGATRTLGATEKATSRTTRSFISMRNIVQTLTKALISMVGILIAFNLLITLPQAICRGLVGSLQAALQAVRNFQESILSTQAVLATTVSFADDLGTSFKLAGKVAEAVQREFIRRNKEIIGTAEDAGLVFQTLLGTGAQNLVRNFQELVDLSILFTNAIIAVTPGQEKQRQLASETAAFLRGQVRTTDRLAKLLGLSETALRRIRDNAKTAKDFFDQMAFRLEAIARAGLEFGKTFTGLTTSIKDLSRLISIDLFTPLFDRIRSTLERLRDAISDNLTGIVRDMIPFASTLEVVLESLVTGLESRVPDLTNVVNTLNAAVTALANTVDRFIGGNPDAFRVLLNELLPGFDINENIESLKEIAQFLQEGLLPGFKLTPEVQAAIDKIGELVDSLAGSDEFLRGLAGGPITRAAVNLSRGEPIVEDRLKIQERAEKLTEERLKTLDAEERANLEAKIRSRILVSMIAFEKERLSLLKKIIALEQKEATIVGRLQTQLRSVLRQGLDNAAKIASDLHEGLIDLRITVSDPTLFKLGAVALRKIAEEQLKQFNDDIFRKTQEFVRKITTAQPQSISDQGISQIQQERDAIRRARLSGRGFGFEIDDSFISRLRAMTDEAREFVKQMLFAAKVLGEDLPDGFDAAVARAEALGQALSTVLDVVVTTSQGIQKVLRTLTEQARKAIEQQKTAAIDFVELFKQVADTIRFAVGDAFAQALVELFSGGGAQSALAAFGAFIGSVLIQLGSAFVAMGTASLFASLIPFLAPLFNPAAAVGLIAAGAGMIALGAAMGGAGSQGRTPGAGVGGGPPEIPTFTFDQERLNVQQVFGSASQDFASAAISLDNITNKFESMPPGEVVTTGNAANGGVSRILSTDLKKGTSLSSGRSIAKTLGGN